ncbi:MAG TPA: hypothetical protein VFD52_04220 [Clostridia bacterium]|nr:hypothetical protein [Clostridia bacterium]
MVKVKRKNGEITRLIHAEYLPAYYYIPKEILDKCGFEINQIPRVPREIATSRQTIKLIESDLFWQVISDAYAYMVWPFMMPKVKREIYSGNEPSWVAAHSASVWIEELTDIGFLPKPFDFWSNLPDEHFGYVSLEEVSDNLAVIVPKVMEKYNLQAIFDIANKYRCFEDFDFRQSRQKTDFFRKWYHTRWKYKQISYEAYLCNLREDKENYWDLADFNAEYENKLLAKIKVDEFKKTLTAPDLKILEYRMNGLIYEDIAKRLGYANHSNISKRMKKLQGLWEVFEGKYDI